MDDHGRPLVDDGRCLYEEPSGMEKRQDNEHDVVEVKLKENISVQAVKKGLAVRQYCAFGLAGGS
ncbi:hypothetical protein ES703_118367 [subsurface metagenome]